MAANRSPDRRRRVSSPPPRKAPTWAIPAALTACLVLLTIMPSFDEDASYVRDAQSMHLENFRNPPGREQRRFLLNDGASEYNEERVMDVGIDENLWRRQLRARKESLRRMSVDGSGEQMEFTRSMAEAADYSTEGIVGSNMPMRRMAVIPRYVSSV